MVLPKKSFGFDLHFLERPSVPFVADLSKWTSRITQFRTPFEPVYEFNFVVTMELFRN